MSDFSLNVRQCVVLAEPRRRQQGGEISARDLSILHKGYAGDSRERLHRRGGGGWSEVAQGGAGG